MSRRGQITMSEDEVADFVGERRTVVLASIKPDGRPHLVPMWFVPDGPAIEVWSFAKAQKVVNLRRDPRATLLLEAGDTYDQLRGVFLECEVEVLDGVGDVERIGLGLLVRYGQASPGDLSEADREAFRARAAKRVGLRFTPTRTISWDHRKLGGAY